MKLENLYPERVFYYFEKLTEIPHGSRNTKQISDYLVSFAKEHELKYYQDESNNVIIVKEATAGYENADTIIIQGHMDMVCEKENGCNIDFTKDSLDIFIDGDPISVFDKYRYQCCTKICNHSAHSLRIANGVQRCFCPLCRLSKCCLFHIPSYIIIAICCIQNFSSRYYFISIKK